VGLLIWFLGLTFQVNADFLFGSEVEEVTSTTVVDFYERRKVSARSGRSAVDMPTELVIFSPLYVVGTVLFRPFPWEARSPAMAMTALENIFFLWFFVSRGKVLWANLKLSRKNMLLALCIFLSLGIMAFQSGTGNLGLIARQRVQFLPYLFMLFM
jgi:hypothetical protein